MINVITTTNHKINLSNIYNNSSCFLILGGPSFKDIMTSKNKISFGKQSLLYTQCLSYPGFLTMGVNNAVSAFRPNLWTSVDEPNRFLQSIWLDPSIQKFIPQEHMNKNIFDSSLWKQSNIQVINCPNVFGIERNERFNPYTFLTENTFNWGDHKNYGGSRSVMLITIKLLYYLGIRKIFLLGCDFYMDKNTKYHFKQDRSKQAINNNNKTYKKMIERFEQLYPIFNNAGLQIYNCNDKSQLKVFPFINIEDAIKETYSLFNIDIKNERVEGLYDREAKERQAQNPKKPARLIQPGMKNE